MVNTKQPAYDQYQAAYKAGTYTAGGIVVKVVQNVDWKKANRGGRPRADLGRRGLQTYHSVGGNSVNPVT